MLFHQPDQAWPVGQVDTDNQCMADLVLGHALKNVGCLAGKIRKIEVAVGINEHEMQNNRVYVPV